MSDDNNSLYKNTALLLVKELIKMANDFSEADRELGEFFKYSGCCSLKEAVNGLNDFKNSMMKMDLTISKKIEQMDEKTKSKIFDEAHKIMSNSLTESELREINKFVSFCTKIDRIAKIIDISNQIDKLEN